jgi:hypothetical protein
LRALAVAKESLHLTLTDLEISVLSPSITDVTQLTSLRLDNNRIRELPPHLFNMTNLTVLSLKDNKIDYIPVELLELTSLTRLNLDNNDLAAFPREIVSRGLSVLKDYLSKIRSAFLVCICRANHLHVTYVSSFVSMSMTLVCALYLQGDNMAREAMF